MTLLEHPRGDSLHLSVKTEFSSLVGFWIFFTIKISKDDPDPGVLQYKFQAPDTQPYRDGYALVEVTAADMDTVPVGGYYYDVQVVEDVSPRVVTTVTEETDTIKIYQDVTRSTQLPTDAGVPQVLSWILPALYTTATTVPITSATWENATHYQITATNVQPALADANWIAVGSYTATIAFGAEGDYTRYLWVKSATAVSAAFAAQTCTVDLPSVITFSAGTTAVNEGAQATLTVTRTSNTHGALSVNIAQIAGAAALGTDYTLTASTVTWQSGDAASKVITLSASADLLTEGAETATLQLNIASGQATYGTNRTNVVTIADTSTGTTGITRLATTLATLNAAIAASQPGDTVLMADGTWNATLVNFSANGNADTPAGRITLRPQTLGGVTFTGVSRIYIAGNYLVADGFRFAGNYTPGGGFAVVYFRDSAGTVNATYSRLTNTTFDGYNDTVTTNNSVWVRVFGDHNEVDHCYFANKTGQGQYIETKRTNAPDYHSIHHNYFGPRVVQSNLGEAVKIGGDTGTFDSASYTTVENNYAYLCHGEGELISSKSSNNTIRYNTIDQCQSGISLRQGNACDIYGNFIFGRGMANTDGIGVGGADHRIWNNYIEGVNQIGAATEERGGIRLKNGELGGSYTPVENAIVVFNTIIDSGYSINIGNNASVTNDVEPDGCIVANNLISTAIGACIEDQSTPTNHTWASNICFGTLGITNPGGGAFITTDPGLTLDDDGIYRPAIAGNAKNAATGTYAFVTDDMDGQARSTSPHDIGADELLSAVIVRRPLTALDVGPIGYDP